MCVFFFRQYSGVGGGDRRAILLDQQKWRSMQGQDVLPSIGIIPFFSSGREGGREERWRWSSPGSASQLRSSGTPRVQERESTDAGRRVGRDAVMW